MLLKELSQQWGGRVWRGNLCLSERSGRGARGQEPSGTISTRELGTRAPAVRLLLCGLLPHFSLSPPPAWQLINPFSKVACGVIQDTSKGKALPRLDHLQRDQARGFPTEGSGAIGQARLLAPGHPLGVCHSRKRKEVWHWTKTSALLSHALPSL